ncbi:MAG: DMT family transporter [Ruminococcaceae bacterium]|nr:DMT family transporter [Oscillospiraceae bacterium]
MKNANKNTAGPFQRPFNKTVFFSYTAIVLVVFVWGLSPHITSYILQYYSSGLYSATGALLSGIALLFLCFPILGKLDKRHLKIAVPTGFFNALANLLQKIGLQYTTPTQYAFLENLSCVVVPILLYLFVRKKPGVMTVSASALCLFGCFVLSGMHFSGGMAMGKGELLCALAGFFYGVNIAATGAFAKDMHASLYVLVQTWVTILVSFGGAIILSSVKINGAVLEPLRFSWNPFHLLLVAVLALFVSTLCWIIRTNAMKHVSASVVAIMMPFSSVITGILSVLMGKDALTSTLLIGGGLIFLAAILSGLDDILIDRRQKKSSIQ